MDKIPIYTIGYGSRTINEFIEILKKHQIEFLIDVRSNPYSKRYPEYNQENLKNYLKENQIQYVFMGEELGGKPKDVSCYNQEGKVDYHIIKTKDFFQKGIERLKKAYEKNISVALMCSELDPCECHRSKLIGKTLSENNISVMHIDENNKLKDQYTVILEINKGKNEVNLFGETQQYTSRKSYLDIE